MKSESDKTWIWALCSVFNEIQSRCNLQDNMFSWGQLISWSGGVINTVSGHYQARPVLIRFLRTDNIKPSTLLALELIKITWMRFSSNYLLRWSVGVGNIVRLYYRITTSEFHNSFEKFVHLICPICFCKIIHLKKKWLLSELYFLAGNPIMFDDIYTRLLQEDGSPRLIQDVNHQIFTDLIVSNFFYLVLLVGGSGRARLVEG